MVKLIVANWKMNPQTFKEADALFNSIKQRALKTRNIQTIIAPPLIFLQVLSSNNKAKRIRFAAQNISFANDLAQVGEASVKQVKDVGAIYVLIGHSARRFNGETDLQANLKVIKALDSKLIPILFVGENERDQDGNFLHTIREQILVGLKEIPKTRTKDIVICYEPTWAISTNDSIKQITVHEIHQMSLFIRKILTKMFDENGARKIQVLYGGSVNEANVKDILNVPGIEGVVVGGASLNAVEFDTILQIANKV